MVERCQTAHLPDPYDTDLIKQGLSTYYTSLVLGNIDFAIIEDRKFKSGPIDRIENQGSRLDHITDANYNPESLDKEGLKLLGGNQLQFLDSWATKKNNSDMKVVLSQTGFCGTAHLLGSINNRVYADFDSNGWPQSGRNKALRIMSKANAVHIAGDQHLATVIQHGIDEFNDGPWAFVVPAIVNDVYKRWWSPEGQKAGINHNPESKLPWTGEYLDGFKNKISMHAYANPNGPSEGAGYGIIKFNKSTMKVTFECWPRFTDLPDNDEKQFPGWPVTINLRR
jgi:hypothetical protein